MSLVVSQTQRQEFSPHPEGQFAARCIDAVDVGWKETQYGWKYKIRLVLFAGEWVERAVEDEMTLIPLTVQGYFTSTLDERGRLLPFLTAWRGKAFTKEELDGFDLEKLVGAPALVTVIHNQSGDRTYANISSISPLPKAMKDEAPEIPEEYVRVHKRPNWEGPAAHPEMSQDRDINEDAPKAAAKPLDEPDDDLPF